MLFVYFYENSLSTTSNRSIDCVYLYAKNKQILFIGVLKGFLNYYEFFIRTLKIEEVLYNVLNFFGLEPKDVLIAVFVIFSGSKQLNIMKFAPKKVMFELLNLCHVLNMFLTFGPSKPYVLIKRCVLYSDVYVCKNLTI